MENGPAVKQSRPPVAEALGATAIVRVVLMASAKGYLGGAAAQ